MRVLPLLLAASLVVLAGCLPTPTGDPPPHPQPTFEYEYSQSDEATALEIRTVDPGGLSDHPLRIRVGDHVAYENASFRAPYTESRRYENEWVDGVEAGESLSITNGTDLARGVEVVVEVVPNGESEYVAVSSDETPR